MARMFANAVTMSLFLSSVWGWHEIWLGPEHENSRCDNSTFPVDLTGFQYKGLYGVHNASSIDECRQACCNAGKNCQIYQWSKHPSKSPDCWIGKYQPNPYPDANHVYISRGREMPTPPKPPPLPKGPYTLDDSDGLGLRFEGIGAISGGGATTKLLIDYDKDVASDILDFMFKPNFGLGLQILKVEVGGDTDATEGAEPSHMHGGPADENYNRGYEWWLMKEARARNPDIKLYGLPWGWPGWLAPNASPDHKPQEEAVFDNPQLTANYTLAWLEGAKREHGLTIDYIGQWNERNAPSSYATALREAVYTSPVLNNETYVLNRLPHYPGTGNQMDQQGCEQYPWNTTDGSRWVDEEGSIYDGRSARCLARTVNRGYVTGCHTAMFQWHLISSFYDYLPWARCGVAVANTPWSGSYEITSPTWVLAHTTQFAKIGWRYTKFGNGTTFLEKGGSMVTRVSPDRKDFSIVLEKMDASNSACARGSNPELGTPSKEDVELILQGSFLKAVTEGKKTLQVWRSNLTSGSNIGQNPPDEQLFVKAAMPLKIDGGRIKVTVSPDEIVTVTTITTGRKGTPSKPIPESKPFPIPFTQNFDDENLSGPGKYWYDQMGAFEVQNSPYNEKGKVLRQLSPVWPGCWGYSCSGPTSYFGPATFNMTGGLALSVRARLEDEGILTFGASGGNMLAVGTDGTWHFGKNEGKTDFAANVWNSIKVQYNQTHQSAFVNGKKVATVESGAKDGNYVKVQLNRYIKASLDDFAITH